MSEIKNAEKSYFFFLVGDDSSTSEDSSTIEYSAYALGTDQISISIFSRLTTWVVWTFQSLLKECYTSEIKRRTGFSKSSTYKKKLL